MNQFLVGVLAAKSRTSEGSARLRGATALACRYEGLYSLQGMTISLERIQKLCPVVAFLPTPVLQPDPLSSMNTLHQSASHNALILLADIADMEIAVGRIPAEAND